MGRAILDELASTVPDLRLLTAPDETAPFRRDETAFVEPGQPLAVALPRSTAEVQALVRLCARHGVPIVPRGAGTGLSGGAIAVDGAITVVMTGMDAILGRLLDAADDPDTVVMVMSDHGFTNFRRGVNLNAWLRDHGYLVLKDGRMTSSDWFDRC